MSNFEYEIMQNILSAFSQVGLISLILSLFQAVKFTLAGLAIYYDAKSIGRQDASTYCVATIIVGILFGDWAIIPACIYLGKRHKRNTYSTCTACGLQLIGTPAAPAPYVCPRCGGAMSQPVMMIVPPSQDDARKAKILCIFTVIAAVITVVLAAIVGYVFIDAYKDMINGILESSGSVQFSY